MNKPTITLILILIMSASAKSQVSPSCCDHWKAITEYNQAQGIEPIVLFEPKFDTLDVVIMFCDTTNLITSICLGKEVFVNKLFSYKHYQYLDESGQELRDGLIVFDSKKINTIK